MKLLGGSSGILFWDLKFRRALRSWEEDDLDNLVMLLNSTPSLREGVSSCFIWKGASSFSVKEVYSWWMHKSTTLLENWKFLWNPMALFRV